LPPSVDGEYLSLLLCPHTLFTTEARPYLVISLYTSTESAACLTLLLFEKFLPVLGISEITFILGCLYSKGFGGVNFGV